MSGFNVGIRVCIFQKGLNEPIMHWDAVVCRPESYFKSSRGGDWHVCYETLNCNSTHQYCIKVLAECK